MYRGLRNVVGTAIALTFIAAVLAPAAVADPKVVIEQFSGAGAKNHRESVRKALASLKVEVVSDKKLAATEADLGLMQASDAYGAVAKQLGATHFLSGSSGGKKPLFTLVAKDDSGKKVGQKVFRGKNPKQLDGVLAAQLPKALSELLGVSGGAAVAAAPVVDEPEATPAPAPTAREEKKAARQERQEKEEKKAAEAEERKATRETAKQEREAKKAAASKKAKEPDDESLVEKDEDEEADEDEPAKAPKNAKRGAAGWTGLDASVGAFIYSRNFTYNQKGRGDQEEYKTDPVAPAIAANVEYFFLPYLGLALGGDYTVGLSSAKGNATFGTTAMSFHVGPKGKIDFGPLQVSLLAAYAKHTFKLERSVEVDDEEVLANVPDADYSMVRAVLGARLDLGVVALFGTFGYDHVLDMGTFKDAFPNATAAATEGSLGVIVPASFLLRGLDFRAAFFARSYGIAMNSENGDDNTAGGALDKYMGGVLSVGYRTP